MHVFHVWQDEPWNYLSCPAGSLIGPLPAMTGCYWNIINSTYVWVDWTEHMGQVVVNIIGDRGGTQLSVLWPITRKTNLPR